ncbi:MAG: septum formation initiator family protein [Patescibacteria group bacterium]|nr:septum formation initiator family protein [Patescibacteria group bacterium]
MSIGKKRLLTYVVLVASILVAINLVKDIIRLSRADQRLVEAEAELQAAKNEQGELKRQLQTAGSGYWLEKQIRNVLKMARPDEVVVVVPEVVHEVTKIEPLGQVAASEPESNPARWRQVFGF